MPDDIELYGTAAGEVAAAVAGTSPGREGLEWLADIIRGRRARTQIKVLTKTAEALDKAGLSPGVVPDKVLVPLLEFAGLEDENDEPMLDRWANLLATASTHPDQGHIAFPEILRQLEPVEAQMLDAMFDQLEAEVTGESDDFRRLDGFGPAWFKRTLGISDLDFARAVPNLVRLQLVFPKGGPNEPPHIVSFATNDLLSSPVQMTSFGTAFVDACRLTVTPSAVLGLRSPG